MLMSEMEIVSVRAIGTMRDRDGMGRVGMMGSVRRTDGRIEEGRTQLRALKYPA
jgi:hypothetical protein